MHEALTAQAALARATGMVMALVPCTAETARRILLEAARAAGTTREHMSLAAAAMLRSGTRTDSPLQQSLRSAMAHAQALTDPLPGATAAMLPGASVLRRHLNHLRAARRRTMDAPEDPALRAELEDAGYSLCLLTGQRSVHRALLTAEQAVATQRLPSVEPN
ncbi:DUF5133 domain-containing protein [Streptomyces polychromogenes]|nr:DUF5133 domain-containing protein [Streptomyces polychromogenes]